MELTMDLAFWVALISALLAAVGLMGIIGGASFAGRPVGPRVFRIGSMAMTAAGIIVLVSSLADLLSADQLFGGVMMIIFGTAVSLPKRVDEARTGTAKPAA